MRKIQDTSYLHLAETYIQSLKLELLKTIKDANWKDQQLS